MIIENDDLNLILNNNTELVQEEISRETTLNSETSLSQTNVSLLDEESKSSEEEIAPTPESLLEEYSNYDLENEKLLAKIEEIKADNADLFKMIEEINKEVSNNQSKQEELKNQIKESMILYDKKNISNDFWNVTYVASYTKTTFDRKGFEKKYPVLAKQFISTSTVSDSTRWTKAK